MGPASFPLCCSSLHSVADFRASISLRFSPISPTTKSVRTRNFELFVSLPFHLLIGCGDIQPYCLIHTTGGQRLAIRTKGHGPNNIAMAGEGGEFTMGGHIPELDALIV